jgi:curved DNA-binding protein CbpA
MQYHPDRFSIYAQRVFATAKMVTINEAYGVLSNPEKRASYDRLRGFQTIDPSPFVHLHQPNPVRKPQPTTFAPKKPKAFNLRPLLLTQERPYSRNKREREDSGVFRTSLHRIG